MSEGFLSRWSKRKMDERAGKPLAEPEVSAVPREAARPVDSINKGRDGQTNGQNDTDDSAHRHADLAVMPASDYSPGQSAPVPAPAAELPTLADTVSLTPESDFRPFMARGVAADVKNAAMKKLFADPHFNVMDRLDTYIDDYSLPDPIPEAMLRKMVSAKFLNLFDDEDKPQEAKPDQARDDPDTAASKVVAQSPLASQPPTLEPPRKNDDLDMRLQPDHAPAAQAAGRGAA